MCIIDGRRIEHNIYITGVPIRSTIICMYVKWPSLRMGNNNNNNTHRYLPSPYTDI